jgi:hypothetical protein
VNTDPAGFDPSAPPFGAPVSLPQQFHLERALTGLVAGAESRWRHWRGGRWGAGYPHLGDQRFEFVLSIPPGTVSPYVVELQVRLDPWVASMRCHTPSFDNHFELRELTAPGAPPLRTWRGTRSIGSVAMNQDGVSGGFERVYFRLDQAPYDRNSYVILNGGWRAA